MEGVGHGRGGAWRGCGMGGVGHGRMGHGRGRLWRGWGMKMVRYGGHCLNQISCQYILCMCIYK